MRWTIDPSTIELVGERAGAIDLAADSRAYDAELLLCERKGEFARAGLLCFVDGVCVSSIVIGSAGTCAPGASCLILDDASCFVAVGCDLICVSIPQLAVRWHQEADEWRPGSERE
jgi:hypothetical protein